MWFRLFWGFGLHFKDTSRHGLTFSERNGLQRRIRVGRWSIRKVS
jgi:hypothetical protein